MHIHLIGVCGTGMGALAGLLAEAGYRVTGSDVRFDPPTGPALARWGVETRVGWDPDNLRPTPDLVVIGNVCRSDNPEARAAIDRGLPYTSMAAALADRFLADRPAWVVTGSHGKTTTTSLLAHLLHEGGKDPGMLVGGIPRGFEASFRVGGGDAPFVIEGDEYDNAFFDKTPKMWRYRPHCAILTSIEHDHIDIYPDAGRYEEAFAGLIERIPQDGLLVAWAGSPRVRALAARARCRVRWYALDRDDVGDVAPVWMGAVVATQGGIQPFDLFVGGTFCGRVGSPLPGVHNIRNALAAMAVCAEEAALPVGMLTTSLARFEGVHRRQELLGTADGVHVYDDFAHHPSEVRETLRALRARHPQGRLLAAFEPRSATACRSLHQDAYPDAFAGADHVWIAPPSRTDIPADERLDVEALARVVRERGGQAEAPGDIAAIADRIATDARPGDTVALLSNGPFGGLHDRVLVALTRRRIGR